MLGSIRKHIAVSEPRHIVTARYVFEFRNRADIFLAEPDGVIGLYFLDPKHYRLSTDREMDQGAEDTVCVLHVR